MRGTSENSRMFCVGRDPKAHPVPALCHEQRHKMQLSLSSSNTRKVFWGVCFCVPQKGGGNPPSSQRHKESRDLRGCRADRDFCMPSVQGLGALKMLPGRSRDADGRLGLPPSMLGGAQGSCQHGGAGQAVQTSHSAWSRGTLSSPLVTAAWQQLPSGCLVPGLGQFWALAPWAPCAQRRSTFLPVFIPRGWWGHGARGSSAAWPVTTPRHLKETCWLVNPLGLFGGALTHQPELC